MVERFTISMPDELFKRLQKVKQVLNVSGICQEALDREITLAELRKKGSKTMSVKDAKERLKMEKKESEQECEDFGHETGLKDAATLSYDDLKKVGDTEWEDLDEDLSTLDAGYGNRVGELCFQDTVNRDECVARGWTDESQHNRFFRGWCRGVREFWLEVKDDL